MTLSRPAQVPVPAGLARPLPLGAWRELLRRGDLPAVDDPDGLAAALVRRWHQHFAVAIDAPVEQAGTGSERLPQLLAAWLDVARRTAPVRAYVERHAGPRTRAEQRRQSHLLAGLLAEDLGLLGLPEPAGRAAELVRELAAVAAAEDRAGRRLPAARAALLRSVGLAAPARRSACLAHRVAVWLHLSPA